MNSTKKNIKIKKYTCFFLHENNFHYRNEKQKKRVRIKNFFDFKVYKEKKLVKGKKLLK